MPVISLYLDTRPNDVGREGFEPFLRKELQRAIESYPPRSPERDSIEADVARIREHVQGQLAREVNTLVVFACSAAGLFEALPLDASLGDSRLFVGTLPHLYPLARLLDQYRRYAVLVADSHVARVLVFGLGTELRQEQVESPKMRRTMVGGWSQMRYQRHVDNRHLKHAKEAAHALARVVREEGIEHVILAGDEVILPMLREEMPKEVADLVIDTLTVGVRAPEHEILEATLEAFRNYDATDDRDAVRSLKDEYRAGGLAVAGLRDTLAALEVGQVDELVLPADPNAIRRPDGQETQDEALGGDLVSRARRTGAAVRFIEDASLLADIGGVGAFLRYRLTAETAVPPVDLTESIP